MRGERETAGKGSHERDVALEEGSVSNGLILVSDGGKAEKGELPQEHANFYSEPRAES